MSTFLQAHPLIAAITLILIELALWQLIGASRRNLRMCVRVGIFVLFCWVMLSVGISPLQPPLWPEDPVLNLMATVLGIGWWLFAARTLTVILGNGLMSRAGRNARLLYDLMGALIFLVGIIGAAAYVLQLPVKGLLATSGAMAIVIALAVQSTLSDLFSGIVINTTKPYQLGDQVSIEGTQGKVVEIDWRSTHLITDLGAVAVVPNSVAAKARIINFSRPGNAQGVSVTIAVPRSMRPRRVIDALEKNLARDSGVVTGVFRQSLDQEFSSRVHRVRTQGLHRVGTRQDRSVQPDVRSRPSSPRSHRCFLGHRSGQSALEPSTAVAGGRAYFPLTEQR
nr:mechanosensitive ion channel domain-containing protein [Pseudomonas gingeri]